MEQWNRIESPEINPGMKRCQDRSVGERTVFSTNGVRKTGYPCAKGKLDIHVQKNKVGALSDTIYKNGLNIKDLNVRAKTIKLFFFFFPAKSFIVSIWSMAGERAPVWLTSCLLAAERGFRQKP